jgi:hypothetical protein
MGAGQEDLRPAGFAPYVEDIGADAVAVAEQLARQHFVAADDGFAATEIDDDAAIFDALDDAVDDIADAILEFLVLAVALCTITCLADCAAMRPYSSGGSVSAMVSPTWAPGLARWASTSEIWLAGFSTCSTTSIWRDSRSSPFLASISAWTSVSLP